MKCIERAKVWREKDMLNMAPRRPFMLSEMSSMMEATEAVDATMNFPSEVIMLGEAFD